ncbi:hypothetical protein C6A36_01740 [Desulfobacteraceae bacterium SEEP-SAG10]|nr:hypothetical protein C6A36_01740 [Desulfobacteraceae bacterium SEEP-SAG10]
MPFLLKKIFTLYEIKKNQTCIILIFYIYSTHIFIYRFISDKKRPGTLNLEPTTRKPLSGSPTAINCATHCSMALKGWPASIMP